MKLYEVDNDDALGEAMWWVQRWVSGCIDDPDWETDWLKKVKDVETAFKIVHNIVGNKFSRNKVLWRYLKLSKSDAKKLITSKILQPFNNQHSPFQSFTTKKSVALDLPDELNIRTGNTNILIKATVPENLVMFGMADLLKSKKYAVQEYISALDLWYDQEEVIVYMKNPLPVIDVKII